MYPAIHSWSFRERFKQDPAFTIFRALDEAAAMGFTGMEIMTGKANMPPEHIGTDNAAGLRKVLRHAQQAGVRIHSYATYNDFAYVKDETWRLANVEYIKTWLRLAGETGVPNIRMLTGYYVPGEDRARLEDLVRRGIEACIPVAEAAGVNMAIENHNSIFFQGAEIAELILRMGSPRLTACPDPSNGFPIFDAACPAATVDAMYANLSAMAPLATASHLKIHSIAPDGSLLGWDLDRLVGAYRQAKYDGPIAFEAVGTGDLLASLPRARELVKAAIDRAG
jgi:sugar phosphate isomerase/epimerase